MANKILRGLGKHLGIPAIPGVPLVNSMRYIDAEVRDPKDKSFMEFVRKEPHTLIAYGLVGWAVGWTIEAASYAPAVKDLSEGRYGQAALSLAAGLGLRSAYNYVINAGRKGAINKRNKKRLEAMADK